MSDFIFGKDVSFVNLLTCKVWIVEGCADLFCVIF